MWEVEVTDEFLEWWSTLTIEQQEAVTDRIDVLAERGPDLGRPIVDRIHASRHQSMKELRAGAVYSVSYSVSILVAKRSCCSAVTKLASGTIGTSGLFLSPMTSSTHTLTNSETKD